MKFELFFIIIISIISYNIYYDGKLFAKIKSYEKYYKIAFIIFIGLSSYLYIKKNPHEKINLLNHTNNYIKTLPLDNTTKSVLSPIVDFASTSLKDSIKVNNNSNINNQYYPNNNFNRLSPQQQKILVSGNKSTKRSVSETKKKYVAASQNWSCKHCKKQLPAWFEVDHVIKLEYGGSNHVDNLVALCRDCHGKKTAMENL